MNFPSNGSGRPYVRIDGRTGDFALSCPDGDPEVVEMKNRLVDIDIAGADQGCCACPRTAPNGCRSWLAMPGPRRRGRAQANGHDHAADGNQDAALAIWDASVPVMGTVAETYLAARGVARWVVAPWLQVIPTGSR
jgi:hypothetical protein